MLTHFDTLLTKGILVITALISTAVSAANNSTVGTQPNVVSNTKDHALFLWIHLTPEADPKAVGKVMSNLPNFVDKISKGSTADMEELLAGVGFGPNTLTQITGRKPRKNFYYPYRKGTMGDMPSTGGDVFVHGKSNSRSRLFELAQMVLKNLPANSTKDVVEFYSFNYQNNRDLSGFIDGTENPGDTVSRSQVAVDPETGGSYCITQKWVHQFDVINNEKDGVLEGFVGRAKADSQELRGKPATSHVARMTSGPQYQSTKPVQIVRQSMPYGTASGESGLFFIGFAGDPYNFEYMLDRMVGATSDGLCDDIMRISRCTSGTYWYFPSVEELRQMAGYSPSVRSVKQSVENGLNRLISTNWSYYAYSFTSLLLYLCCFCLLLSVYVNH